MLAGPRDALAAVVADSTTRAPRTLMSWSTTGAIASGTLLQPVNSSMISLAITSLTLEFGQSDLMPWVISAMYVATAVAAPISGRLGALLGPRRVYLAGLATILAGSVAGLLAPSLAWVVVSRVVVGLGAAAQYPNAVALIRRYAKRADASKGGALGLLVMSSQVTATVGPTLGGLLVGAFGWHAVMWVNVPAVAVSAAMVLFWVDRDEPGTARERGVVALLDLPGLALFLGSVVPLMLFLLSVAKSPHWILLGVAAVCAVVLVLWERGRIEPFLDVSALRRNRALSGTMLRTLLTYTAFYSIFYGIPQWLQFSRGYSAAEAGLVMLPLAAVGVVCTPVGSWICRSAGPRRALAWGTTAMIVGGGVIALAAGANGLWLVLVLAVLAGIPSGFNNIGNQAVIDLVTPDGEIGTAMGLYRTAQYIGANFAAVLLEVLTRGHPSDAGFERQGWALMAIGFVLLAVSLGAKSLAPQRLARAEPR
nr:MFS transporter [Amycolatopsis rubida]